MSREIKFRIWKKSIKKYVDLTTFTITNDGEITAVVDSNILEPALNKDDYIIEQYTGLKDKNGKEIYDGDIVKTNSPDRANFNAGAIVMQQQMYLIINTPTYGDARLSHSEPLGYYCDMECEIIGNIHENPELLGGEE